MILTEPLLDPAVEAQAVGRVHRIGQTQPTYVHRYTSLSRLIACMAGMRASTVDIMCSGTCACQALFTTMQSWSLSKSVFLC